MDRTPDSFALEIATTEDVTAIVTLWFAAFTQDVIKRLFPDTPAMRTWHENWHRGDMETKKDFQTYLKVVDTAKKDEQGQFQLVAFGKWDKAMPDERGRRFPEWCKDSPYEECQGLIDTLEGERARVMGSVRHYCMNSSLGGRYEKPGNFANSKYARYTDLDTLATHPDYQGRGAGSMIVKYGCDLADQDGVSAYVDASKEGLVLYKRYGFVDHGQPESDVASMARFRTP